METPSSPPGPVDGVRAVDDHTSRVASSAGELLHRFHAVRALGTLHGEPQPLASSIPEVR
jgi:hypothetical protein